MMGRWLAKEPVDFEVIDTEFDWLEPYFATDASKVAALLVLADMVPFRKRENAHTRRMWNLYLSGFAELVGKSLVKLADSQIEIASFRDGEVLPHFQAHANEDAIFICYAPGYTGKREEYRACDDIVNWADPDCDPFNEAHADEVLEFIKQGRRYLWFDTRELPGLQPVALEKAGKDKQWDAGGSFKYLYSNLTSRKAVHMGVRLPRPQTALPLAQPEDVIDPTAEIVFQALNPNDLMPLKSLYLGKAVRQKVGKWPFAVYIGGTVFGFIEFDMPMFARPGQVYLNSDFPVSGTRYKRLSKLMAMLAVSGDSRRLMERTFEKRMRSIYTTAFTDRPSSMKYRGVMTLTKRGQTDDGRKFLNYRADFNELSWADTLQVWWRVHGQK